MKTFNINSLTLRSTSNVDADGESMGCSDALELYKETIVSNDVSTSTGHMISLPDNASNDSIITDDQLRWNEIEAKLLELDDVVNTIRGLIKVNQAMEKKRCLERVNRQTSTATSTETQFPVAEAINKVSVGTQYEQTNVMFEIHGLTESVCPKLVLNPASFYDLDQNAVVNFKTVDLPFTQTDVGQVERIKTEMEYSTVDTRQLISETLFQPEDDFQVGNFKDSDVEDSYGSQQSANSATGVDEIDDAEIPMDQTSGEPVGETITPSTPSQNIYEYMEINDGLKIADPEDQTNNDVQSEPYHHNEEHDGEQYETSTVQREQENGDCLDDANCSKTTGVKHEYKCFIPTCNLSFRATSTLKKHAILSHPTNVEVLKRYGIRNDRRSISKVERDDMMFLDNGLLKLTYKLPVVRPPGHLACTVKGCPSVLANHCSLRTHLLAIHRDDPNVWIQYAVKKDGVSRLAGIFDINDKIDLAKIQKQYALPPSRSTKQERFCFVNGCKEKFSSQKRLREHALEKHRNEKETWVRFCQRKDSKSVSDTIRLRFKNKTFTALRNEFMLEEASPGPSKDLNIQTCFVNGCDKAFSDQSYFKDHVINTHPDEIETWVRFACRRDGKSIPVHKRESLRGLPLSKLKQAFVLQENDNESQGINEEVRDDFNDCANESVSGDQGGTNINKEEISSSKNDGKLCLTCLFTKSKRPRSIKYETNDHQVCTKNGKVKCALLSCSNVFEQRSNMLYHFRTSHNYSELKQAFVGEGRDFKFFVCETCKMAFTLKKRYETHMDTHSSRELRKKFSCEICTEKFLRECEMAEHLAKKHGKVYQKK